MGLSIGIEWVKDRLYTRTGRLLRRFGRNKDGATMVEFALVSIPFLGLLFAIFETAFVFFVTQGVDAAVNDAARLVMTGQLQYNSDVKSASDFRTKVLCRSAADGRILPSFINCDDLIVHIDKAASFSSAVTTKDYSTAETYCTGSGGDIVVMRVIYPMPVYLSFLSQTNLGASGVQSYNFGQTQYKGNWVHMIMGTSVFRNEPFPDGTRAVASC
ncbi:MAG: TadE/TadG family type IV pilus assembly protein [Beijerinckiaceae bacterium]